MAASLVHAVRHARCRRPGWLVALGDMPHVQPATIAALAAALAGGAGIAAPCAAGGAATRSPFQALISPTCWR
jgi:molybdenum cofactor cytidylyltransferase